MKMKNLFLILITFCNLTAFSQSATPRTGVGVFHDNTFRAMTIKNVAVTDTVAYDTVQLSLNAYKTLVSIPVLSDTLTFLFPSVASCYLGDEVTIMAIGSGKLNFAGPNVTNGGHVLTVSTRANITFIFDGTIWSAEYSVVQ